MLELLACIVVAIVDGDTLTARCASPAGPVTMGVRLAEIDAPEKRQAFGERSRQHLAGLCFQQSARVRPIGNDRYGRTVARVTCNGIDASVEQVRAGMAWRFARYATDPQFVSVEATARRQGLG